MFALQIGGNSGGTLGGVLLQKQQT